MDGVPSHVHLGLLQHGDGDGGDRRDARVHDMYVARRHLGQAPPAVTCARHPPSHAVDCRHGGSESSSTAATQTTSIEDTMS